jgi:hypothetical protein
MLENDVLMPGAAVQMPHWWGNNADNIERCFALKK